MPHESPVPEAEAPRDCPLCPRLVAFRQELRGRHPDWWNAPVPAFGDREAWLAIIGLAPGKHGANRTGRPFTGDYAGDLLYSTLLQFGFADGTYKADPNDGFTLRDARIANAVRCLPPENKPLPAEFTNCRPFLQAEIPAHANTFRAVRSVNWTISPHAMSPRSIGAAPAIFAQ